MNDSREILQSRLRKKIADLAEYREKFRMFVETDIETSQFERNAIADLNVMMQLKAEISELEFVLWLQ